ncbi:MFS transporter [Mesorhizobium sp. RP14(2022)]|uniref:MFS transporter n=1 Tax=Mesorhizobium liriopis TaxID=2953882 RepID=A0ABT1CAR8_9HYPH|nr:MFS transporter [Mesorhizobium liriopis]MCO6051919.1 MFS transporter [Mesorhizobium liriopis]
MSDWASSSPRDFAEPPVQTAVPATVEKPAWAAVVSLTFGVFGLVTAEFLPASLLTPMAAELGVSNGAAGQAVTATAVVAAFAGPLLVLGSGRIDRQKIVWTLSTMLVVSSLLAAFATNITVLLLARALLGFALGGFWAMAAALALRLVPTAMVPRAMSIIFTGVSVATVFAAPLGAFLSGLWGWRVTFMAAAGIGVVALLVQLATLPKLPPVAAPGLSSFAIVLKRRSVQVGLGTVLLVISGHFAGFTYIRPFLEQVSGLGIQTISLALLAFGIGGFLGNLAGGVIAEKSARIAVGSGSLLLAGAALALIVWGATGSVAFAATALWGFAFGGFPVSISSWNARVAPDQAESAGALLATSFQVAIASGAVIGGLLVDGMGPVGVIGYALVVILAGALLMLVAGRGREQAPH